MRQKLPLKLQAARLVVYDREPYLSVALWRAKYRVFPSDKWPKGCPGDIACTSAGLIVMNEGWLESSPTWDVACGIAHEIGHLIRFHFDRCGNRNPTGWNIATDAAINQDLKRAHWTLDDRLILPEKFGWPAGETAEAYYERLDVQEQTVGIQFVDENGDPIDGGDGSSVHGEGKVTVIRPQCGSVAGNRHPVEDLVSQGEGYGDDPSECPSPVDWEIVRVQVAKAVKERGNSPGGWSRWADEFVREPVLPWQQILASRVRTALMTMGLYDYSYSRPKQRNRMVFPRLRSPVVRAAMVVDTSGSIDRQELCEQISEVGGVLRSCGSGTVRVVATDAAVHSDSMVATVGQAMEAMHGGGGTDMGAGLRYVSKYHQDVVIVLTDGHTPWPQRRPLPCPVIVVVPQGGPETPRWAIRVERGNRGSK